MSLSPKRFLLTEKALANWLNIELKQSIGEADQVIARRVFSVLRGLSHQTWLAAEASIFASWSASLSDLELTGIHRKIVAFLRKDQIRDFSRLYQETPNSWENLPENLAEVEQLLISGIDSAYFWCEPGTEKLAVLKAQLSQLLQGVSEIDIYDPYLILNLTSASRQIDKTLRSYQRNRYVQTLDFICGALTPKAGHATVNLRCPIRAEKIDYLNQIDTSDSDSIYQSLPGLKELLTSVVKKHNGNITFVLELRAERPIIDHGRADMSGEWLHGRFIVVPSVCVVSSDRSMDFVGLRYLSDGGTGTEKLALLDNLLVRWSPGVLSHWEISRRWSALSSVFSGGGLITVGI